MDPKALYDHHAASWNRSKPNSLSDFTGRPAVFELCGVVDGQRVLDLGCGEGYCTREMAVRGGRDVLGIDVSSSMIELARKQEAEQGLGIEYRVGDVRRLDVADDAIDLVLAVFVFSYVTIDEMKQAFREVRRVLAPGGRFVFAVPHPGLPFMREQKPPFYFSTEGAGYFSGIDRRFGGEIACLDGTALPVQVVHKPIESYFEALGEAGFSTLPTVRELGVLPEHLEAHPDFFAPMADLPLHLAFRLDL